ncbi:hypothetical protein C1637_08680 [Chryseobacterium lactis]|uniref:DUF3945 domain-containing protein n=1 Tax=Chryseobacterium lactis TaxID=1241981 RepID=A0A3G6RCJ4_CHRLC|nr:DUF3945 domain-containing protein [Chryseobacterium lactis]AZA82390.1 DUF3945 domain-containing protein [Chryseobacterium lactis]AZB02772.1 DUF3945 domain-containing protein [Chryseobacterium lactis]PNW13934.1 hypothetical protein C1637_08680 [Chryseobacterium lactis]
MSEQTISKENGQQVPEALSDILLVLDKKKNRIEAVKGVDDEGNLQTAEPKKTNLLDFMRVDKGDALSNFFSNFWRRLNDPISFRFFSAPEIDLNEVAKKLQKAIDNPTPEGNKLLDALEIKYDNKLNQKNMETNQTSEGAASLNEAKSVYKYNVDNIDWATLEKFNLSRALLEKNGQLDKLLKGYKSDGVYRIEGNFDGIVMKADARLSFRNLKGTDQVEVMTHGVRVEPDLKNQFYGHAFTAEDRDNLKKTGNMGRVAELTNYSDGTKVKSLISIDKLTNEVVSFPVERIKISEKFGGVKLSPEQKAELLEGRPVLVEGMVNTKTGEVFNQQLQYNADAKKLVFVGQSERQQQELNGIPNEFRGKVIEDKDKKLLESGEVIFMQGIVNKEGTKLYNGYVWQNKETGKLEFDFDNPQQDKTQKQSEMEKEGKGQSNKQDSTPKNTIENTAAKKENTRKPKLH